MDIRRTIIFIGLAISSYLLILAWSADYGQKPQNSGTAAVESTAVNSIVEDVPDTSDAHNAVQTTNNNEAPVFSESQSKPQSTTQIVKVNTDVLEVSIDLKGGEIVSVKLPAYPASNDNKEIGRAHV